MARAQKWFLLILAGIAIMLGGLVWDAAIHSTEHAHLVVEALFDPSNPFENPSHALIGVGLVWTTLAALAGFTWSWLEGKNWRARRQLLSLPLALWLVMGVAGSVALVVLSRTG